MNRTTRNRILLAFALLHLLADVAFAGGAVLCVGSDDHRAVESQYLADLGCHGENPSQPDSTAPSVSDAVEQSGDCTDSPLHSEAEFFAASDRAPDAPAGLVHAAFDQHLASADAARLRPSARTASESSTLRAHRTVVLII